MFSLPRGAFKGRENVRLASSEWARPEEAARFPYRSGGSLYLGALPHEDMWDKLGDLRQQCATLRQAIEQAVRSPIERAAKLAALEALWTDALKADCFPVGLDDDRHAVTIAGARAGKGLSSIIPNLCLYTGSAVVLDPKGENASLTAERRGEGNAWCKGMGQEVFVLDPFGVADVPDALRASFNPLSQLEPDSPLVVDDAALLAEGLILAGSGDGDEHWTESARNLVRGIILHLVSTKPGATLFDVRRLLTQGEKEAFKAADLERRRYQAKLAVIKAMAKQRAKAKGKTEDDADEDLQLPEPPPGLLPEHVRTPFAYLLWQMEHNEAFDGVVAGTAETILGTGDNERGSILSTARRNTAFLDTLGARYKATLAGEFRPFSPELLKSAPRGATVYLCLPAERMGTHGRWLRLMIGLCLERMQRQLIAPACGVPVLFLLEEFFALGTMPSIEKAAGYAAGFGVKLWAILQDLQQLKTLYRTSWQTFLANAGVVQVFGVSDQDTLEYVSKALGDYEVSRETVSRTTNASFGEGGSSDLDRMGGTFQGGGLLRGAISAVWRGSLDDTRTSSNVATSDSQSVGLHIVPLLRPDEIALQFARESAASLVLIKGQRPMWLLRTNYSDCAWFRGLTTPLERWRDQVPQGQAPFPFWERPAQPLATVAQLFNTLSGALSP